MKICVEYLSSLGYSESEDEPYGSWSESWNSTIEDVYEIGDDVRRPYNSEIFLVPDETTEVFVVYMIYSTGDSFGCADGKIDILHCTANREAAHDLAKMIISNPDKSSIEYTDDFGRKITIGNPGYGYFESIDSVEVDRYMVGSGAKKTRYTIN
jgi:hypothetical protein